MTSDSPGAIVLNPDPSRLRVTPVSSSSTVTLIVLSSLAVSSPLDVASISIYTFPSSCSSGIEIIPLIAACPSAPIVIPFSSNSTHPFSSPNTSRSKVSVSSPLLYTVTLNSTSWPATASVLVGLTDISTS